MCHMSSVIFDRFDVQNLFLSPFDGAVTRSPSGDDQVRMFSLNMSSLFRCQPLHMFFFHDVFPLLQHFFNVIFYHFKHVFFGSAAKQMYSDLMYNIYICHSFINRIVLFFNL